MYFNFRGHLICIRAVLCDMNMMEHGNLFARENLDLGADVVSVVYKPVAFQDSAAVTFDHTWPRFMIIIPSGATAF